MAATDRDHSNFVELSYGLIHPAILGSMIYEVLVKSHWKDFNVLCGSPENRVLAVKLWAQLVIAVIYTCDWWYIAGQWPRVALTHVAARFPPGSAITKGRLFSTAGVISIAASFLFLGAFCRASDDPRMTYAENTRLGTLFILLVAVVYALFQGFIWWNSDRDGPKGAGLAAVVATCVVIVAGGFLLLRTWFPTGCCVFVTADGFASVCLLLLAMFVATSYVFLNWKLGIYLREYALRLAPDLPPHEPE